MSTKQRENLEAILRHSAFPVAIDVNEQRRLLRGLLSAQPLPADVSVTAAGGPWKPSAPGCLTYRPDHPVIHAGTHAILLDDAIGLARQAATADVEVSLDITYGVPHVFQAYYPILDEAAAALDTAGQLLWVHFVTAWRKAYPGS